jgi:hypothetical protein
MELNEFMERVKKEGQDATYEFQGFCQCDANCPCDVFEEKKADGSIIGGNICNNHEYVIVTSGEINGKEVV